MMVPLSSSSFAPRSFKICTASSMRVLLIRSMNLSVRGALHYRPARLIITADWVTLDIPSYPKIVKKPMDLSTMRKKLESHLYLNAQKFYEDFKLMIRNCFSFNPAGTPVNQAGIELQRLFDEKWKAQPPLHEVSEDEEEEDEDDSDEDRARMWLLPSLMLPNSTWVLIAFAGTIAMMETQIETMRNSITALKGSKPPKDKKKKEKRDKGAALASSSKGGKQTKQSGKKKSKKPVADDDVLSFEQKKDLSEAISKLDGVKLEKVIHIIHEGVPEIRDVSFDCLRYVGDYSHS
jgi:bromodomain-containing factor 1